MHDHEYDDEGSDIEFADPGGFCVRCNDITRFGDTESDAEGYHCDECDGDTVMGIDQALMCGYIDIKEPSDAGSVE